MNEKTHTNASDKELSQSKSSDLESIPWYKPIDRKARNIELAKKYIEANPKEKYYAVEYIESSADLDIWLFIHFTDDEIKCIHHILSELNFEYEVADILKCPQEITQDENFDNSYKTVFESVVDKLESNIPEVPTEYRPELTDIDFTPTTLYAFRWAIFPNGFDNKPRINRFLARFKDDEDYIRLLALKMEDRSLRFNELRHIMPEEYEYISRQAEYDDPIYCTRGPYAVEMTEIDKDVTNILGEE